jgi:hypothetical protein
MKSGAKFSATAVVAIVGSGLERLSIRRPTVSPSAGRFGTGGVKLIVHCRTK